MLFAVIAQDYKDDDALNRRLKARPDHVAYSDAKRENLLLGMALQNSEGQMNGSLLITDFPNEAACRAWVADDPYWAAKVWENVDIRPFQVGPSFQASYEALLASQPS